MNKIQPGDVIELNGQYIGVKSGAKAVVDSHYFEEDGQVLAVFGASAFREKASFPDLVELAMTEGSVRPFVSCSGGPCPFVNVADLDYVGKVSQTFWRWKDFPRADGGENFVEEVNLWRWTRHND